MNEVLSLLSLVCIVLITLGDTPWCPFDLFF